MNTNEEIRLKIMDEFRWEVKITNPVSIEVAVREGIVTLSGFVDNLMAAVVAGEVATRIPGVKGVVQNIEVRQATKGEHNDFDLVYAACAALDLSPGIPRDHIKVIVRDGWVTLTGDLQQPSQKEEAESIVGRIGGIAGVTNNIVVRPALNPSDIRYQISKAFERRAGHHASHVDVMMQNGKVVLSGMVRACFERAEAERVAREMPGVVEVENKLLVCPLIEAREKEAEEKERLAAMAI